MNESTLYDLKSEVLLIEKNIENLPVLSAQGIFKRGYSKEIYTSNVKKKYPENIKVVEICREGLYDSLPPMLFHNNAEEVVKDSNKSLFQQIEKEEENARLFFLPFEQELFKFSAYLIQSEINYNAQFTSSFLFDKKNLGESLYKQVVKFFPYFHQCRGDLQSISSILQEILQVEINLIEEIKEDVLIVGNVDRLGGLMLSINSVLGGQFSTTQKIIFIEILNLKKKKLKKYINNGKNLLLIRHICKYLLPVGIRYKTRIKMFAQEESPYVLGKQHCNSLLGITTILN